MTLVHMHAQIAHDGDSWSAFCAHDGCTWSVTGCVDDATARGMAQQHDESH
ncbi:MAG TPA: hypothetical protein VFJ12_05160 [Segeticoccus sp.]|nr:hypothetical protein [Segeticoccus sp.]